ncbi:3-methyladenine DNA glycosylase [Pseudactinotalea sp. HY158]|uniref:3-methyladenine DNA glycosylase n=1 Tax=Pseudactinotalea sp. HY158 TaxID=2654547 RepID=UPI00129C515B|nr:3-methyladenine DNA glycosylase [Pseudactinotalea sp. HY158]QGH70523.1 3-methyladenine DNA glycosylase [Pseudactinotalea sp. HY158]
MSTILDREQWPARERAHEARIDDLTRGHRERAGRGEPHPVEDFLFHYYRNPLGHLRRWHPGARFVLAGAEERAGRRFYRMDDDAHLGVDVASFAAEREGVIARARLVLARTASRSAQLACFGLHEWAMVYRAGERPEAVRHPWPLRLGVGGTEDVVESHTIRCTHYDAYRFFTEPAAPRNTVTPTRERQPALEQPGCLHAGMDLYRWAFKLVPVVPSELVADCFDLARRIRVLDMRASPYDLRDLGYEPVAIETPTGKAVYVAAQREFAAEGAGLRARLLAELDHAGL